MAARIYPRRHLALCVYDFLVHDFGCRCPDIIYPANPCHLVGNFQCLGNALSLGHLPDDDVQPLLRLLVNIGKIAVQAAAEQQAGIAGLAVFPNVPQVPLAPYADRLFFFSGYSQTGKVVVANQLIPQAVALA